MTETQTEAIVAPPGYKNVLLVGQGATSRVYRAHEAKTGEPVALKRLHRQLVRSGDALARLKRELEALSQLRHPNIVAVRGVIRWQGDPTIVMDYVPGRDLKERLKEGALPPAELEQVARVLFDILATTHGSGIVHRDIKPQNVRLTPDGRIFLLDFGSARLDAASQLTATGSTVGTPDYMAPELFAGSVYDPRADIYGVGATLFECATGRPPQLADSLAELAFQRTKIDAPKVRELAPTLPENLAQLIDRCLSRKPEDRYATASLATWAIDHPGEERAFLARRSKHPPCLHCMTPIPPASTVCPRCSSDHPFAYARGGSRVDITSISEPQKFIEEILSKFPEWAHPEGVRVLAERCAALSFEKQRYISYIDQTEAERIEKELAAAGARAEISREPRLPLLAIFIGFLVVLLSLAVGFPAATALFTLALPIVAYLAWRRSTALARAQTGIHSGTRLQSVWPLGRALAWGSTLISGALAYGAPSGSPYRLGVLAFAVASFGALIVSLATSFKPKKLKTSPEARLREKLGLMLTVRGSKDATTSEPQRAARAKSAVVFVIAALALVPAEMTAVNLLAEPGLVSKYVPPLFAARPVPTTARSGPLGDGGAIGATGIRRRQSPGERALIYGGLTSLIPLLLAALILRRRRKIVAEAARIEAELDVGALRDLRAQAPDSRSLGRDLAFADRLVKKRPADPFASSALYRAADLAQILPEEKLHGLARLIESISTARREAIQAESLLARCILETDGEQRARFQILALEGELEAIAASAWMEKLRSGSQ